MNARECAPSERGGSDAAAVMAKALPKRPKSAVKRRRCLYWTQVLTLFVGIVAILMLVIATLVEAASSLKHASAGSTEWEAWSTMREALCSSRRVVDNNETGTFVRVLRSSSAYNEQYAGSNVLLSDDPHRRWSSNSSTDEFIRFDLGAVRQMIVRFTASTVSPFPTCSAFTYRLPFHHTPRTRRVAMCSRSPTGNSVHLISHSSLPSQWCFFHSGASFHHWSQGSLPVTRSAWSQGCLPSNTYTRSRFAVLGPRAASHCLAPGLPPTA